MKTTRLVGWLLLATAAACGAQQAATPAAPIVIDAPIASAEPPATPPPSSAPVASAARPSATDDDDVQAKGNMWGDAIGDAFGAGGLGLSAGDGGATIGLGNIGTLGHGAGTGTGQGFGSGTGRGSAPTLRQGATQVSGRLPPEVIQRIVRQNFGRFRLCYENGLRKNPKLGGRISVKFVIDPSGAVKTAADGGSDLPDPAVVTCVVRGFGNLSFPKPESGEVTVRYPIIFAPGDPPAPATSSSAKK